VITDASARNSSSVRMVRSDRLVMAVEKSPSIVMAIDVNRRMWKRGDQRDIQNSFVME